MSANETEIKEFASKITFSKLTVDQDRTNTMNNIRIFKSLELNSDYTFYIHNRTNKFI